MRDPVLFAIPFFCCCSGWSGPRPAARTAHHGRADPPRIRQLRTPRRLGQHLDGAGVHRDHRGLEVHSALLGYAAVYAYVAPWHRATAWYTWVIALVGVDLLFYLYHRIAHRVR